MLKQNRTTDRKSTQKSELHLTQNTSILISIDLLRENVER